MRSFLLAGLLVFAVPAAAKPTLQPPEQPQPAAEPAFDADGAARELGDYAEWMTELNAIMQPMQEALPSIVPVWQQAASEPTLAAASARLRPEIARVLATIDRADAALAALRTPEMGTVPLTPDLEPRQIVSEMRALAEHMRALVRAYQPLLEAAFSNNIAAAERANAQMVQSMRLMLRSQIVTTRASLATTERGESMWEMQNVQLLYFRTAERMAAALAPTAGENRNLATDMIALAQEAETTAREGATKFEAERSEAQASLANAVRDGDQALASILRRMLAAYEVDARLFPLANDLAATLRREAAALGNGAAPIQQVVESMRRLQPLRLRLEAIVREEATAMAGVQ